MKLRKTRATDLMTTPAEQRAGGRFSSVLFLAAAAVLLIAPEAVGQTEASGDLPDLALEKALAIALKDNAQLRAMRARWEAMLERPAQARTLPNPMFAYGGMDMTEQYRFPGTEEKRIELGQTVPFFGKLGLKSMIAAKEAEAMGREFEAMERDLIMMVKEGYFDLYAAQRSLSITRADEEVLERMTRIAETRYAAGRAGEQDVLKAQAEITMLKVKILELEQQEALHKARLNQLLNRRADSYVGKAVTKPEIKTEPELERLFALAESGRPEIKKADAELERNRHEYKLMKKEFFPDYRLALEYRSFRDAEDAVMFTVGFELPIWRNKYKAGVREAKKMIEAGKLAKEAVEQQVSFEVRDAQFKLLTSRRTLELYRTALVPQAQERFEASVAGYRAGRSDFLDLLESQRFLLSARVMEAMAEGSVGMRAARLERAVGADPNGGSQPEPKIEEK